MRTIPCRRPHRHRGPFAGLLALFSLSFLPACTSPDQSFFIYRLPFENGTDVSIWQDHISHNDRIDMAGVNGEAPYRVVAARPGIVRFIDDTNTESCWPSGCANNYVWIEHTPGEEWTKYSHLATGTVTNSPPSGAGLNVGDAVAAGQYLGDEGNIGMVTGSNEGRHLHFHVAIPDDPETATPTGNAGNFPLEYRVPRFCGVPGGIAVMGDVYSAVSC